MKGYGASRGEVADVGQAADPANELMPCGECGRATKRATLSAYGARCFACYGRYLRDGYTGPIPVGQTKRAKWVEELAEKIRQRGSSVPNAFAGLKVGE